MPPVLTLPDNEIHLWICHPDTIREPLLLERYRQLMTPEESVRQQRYRFDKDKHSALITRALVRSVLSRYGDRRPEDWRFIKGEKDKPEIVDPPLPLRFNLSHTEGLIVCAVALHHDLGVDVEFTPRDSDVLNIANRFFSEVEVQELFSLEGEERQRQRFFDYWTLKESYIKAWGQGLAIPLGDFSFHIGPGDGSLVNNDIRLSFAPKRQDNPADWQSWLLYPNPHHRMAISIRSGQHAAYRLHLRKTTPLLSEHDITLPFQA